MTPQCKSTLNAWKHVYDSAAQKGGIGHDVPAKEAVKIFQQALREQAIEVHNA